MPGAGSFLLVIALGLLVGLVVGHLNGTVVEAVPTSRHPNTPLARPTGYVVTTLAGGRYGTFGYIDGAPSYARFHGPVAVAVDRAGYVFVADWRNVAIRSIAPSGHVETVAGGAPGIVDGAYDEARFGLPEGVALDAHGNLFVADSVANCIRKIGRHSGVETWAGVFEPGLEGRPTAGFQDGAGGEARFSNPRAISAGPDGTLIVADSGNGAIRRIGADRSVSTLATFGTPIAVAVAADGTIYVAESSHGTVRSIDPTGNAVTVARDFGRPGGIALGNEGDLYFIGNDRILRLDAKGNLFPVAGRENSGMADGPGEEATFRNPRGLAWDQSGALYVADTGNNRIRVIRKG